MSERFRTVELLKDIAGLVSGLSLLVSGSAAIFTTVYLARLSPVGRLLSWQDRISLALLSVSWQVALLLLIAMTLIVAGVLEEREIRLGKAAGGKVSTDVAAALRSPTFLILALGNATAAASVLFGLCRFELWVPTGDQALALAIPVIVTLGGFVGFRCAHRESFARPDGRMIAGAVAALTWLSAGGWVKAGHDFQRAPEEIATLNGAALPGVPLKACVTIILATERALVFSYAHKIVYFERDRNQRLLAGRCPVH